MKTEESTAQVPIHAEVSNRTDTENNIWSTKQKTESVIFLYLYKWSRLSNIANIIIHLRIQTQ